MNEKVQLLNKIKQLLKLNLENKYNKNIDLFLNDNPNISIFLKNNGYNPNQNIITNEDYLNLFQHDDIKVYKVIPIANDLKKENELFIPLEDINCETLSEEEKKIYDVAIKLALAKDFSHKLSIRLLNNKLSNYIKDENGFITELTINEEKDDEKAVIIDNNGEKKKIKTNDNKGFSDTLILAFIIGSFIGIIFLNVYSRIVH